MEEAEVSALRGLNRNVSSHPIVIRARSGERPSLVASRPFSPGGCAVVSTPGRPWPHQFRFPRLHFVHAQWVYRAAGVARRSGGSSLTG